MNPDSQIPLCCPCGDPELYRRGRCKRCYNRGRCSRARFGGGREKVLRRDRRLCRVCRAPEPLVVHHRRPPCRAHSLFLATSLAHFGGLFWPPCKRASKSLISGHLLSFLGTWSGAEPEGRSAGRCPQKRAPSLLPPSLLLRQRPTKAVGLLARLDDVSAVGNAIQQRLT